MATKRALVVGINDYAPAGAGGPDLNGCINDARDMANTLVICGFPPANIQILTNQNATRVNILTRLKWLVQAAASGDSIVFFYSGHGTRVANLNSDFEVDGLDEAICPHDYATASVIKDDDFASIFSTLKQGVNLDVVFDCCHSGTGTRSVVLLPGLNEPAAIHTPETPRFIEPSLENEFYFAFAKELSGKKSKRGVTEGVKSNKVIVPVPSLNHTLWAACKDNQVSMEAPIQGVVRGYFTYHFCKVLRATTGNITRVKVDAHVANALASMGAAQINQTESKPAEFAQRIFT